MGLADSWEIQLGQEKNALISHFPDRFLQVRAAILERLLGPKKLSQTGEAIPTALINWLLIHKYEVICVLFLGINLGQSKSF